MAARRSGSSRSSVSAGREASGERGRDEDAPAVGQQLACVRVRGRDDRAAGAHRVGQGPGHDLVEVRVGRDEDVRRLEPARQLDPPDEPVDEPDVVLEAKRGDGRDQAMPIGLALAAKQVRMGGADHDVQHGRMRGDDVGQRRDRELVALAGADQAEAEDDLAALDARGAA